MSRTRVKNAARGARRAASASIDLSCYNFLIRCGKALFPGIFIRKGHFFTHTASSALVYLERDRAGSPSFAAAFAPFHTIVCYIVTVDACWTAEGWLCIGALDRN